MELRRNVRANLRARITVRGMDPQGRPFVAEGQSIDFSRRGLGILLQGNVVMPGSIVAVERRGSFASEAVVRWCKPAEGPGETRVGLQLLHPRLTLIARVAAAVLLIFAFVGQVSFARWRGHSRPANSPASCNVSLARMKEVLESRLHHGILVTEAEKTFLHIQHRESGCDEYTRLFENSDFYRDPKKRKAIADWHWNTYHAEDPSVREAAVRHLEPTVAGTE
jgi:hypothetical protein